MNPENVKKAADLLTQAMSLLRTGPLDFYLRELTGAYDFMMARCCPLKVGDRAILIRTPEIDESSGWWGSRHFLVAGSVCTVTTAECGSQGFSFGVMFDDESWINSRDGSINQIEPDRRHTYRFGESFLAKLSTQQEG